MSIHRTWHCDILNLVSRYFSRLLKACSVVYESFFLPSLYRFLSIRFLLKLFEQAYFDIISHGHCHAQSDQRYNQRFKQYCTFQLKLANMSCRVRVWSHVNFMLFIKFINYLKSKLIASCSGWFCVVSCQLRVFLSVPPCSCRVNFGRIVESCQRRSALILADIIYHGRGPKQSYEKSSLDYCNRVYLLFFIEPQKSSEQGLFG